MWKELDGCFSEQFKESTALHKIFHLTQEKTEINLYLDEFDQLKEKSRVGDIAAITLLQKHVNSRIIQALHNQGIIPDFYDKFIEAL